MKKLALEQGLDFHSTDVPKGKLFHTFTVGMGNSPDIMAARAMAKVLGTEHHERIFTPEEALALIPTIVYRSETYEPELLRSCIPNYFLAELASKYVKMVLTGEGADELFSGYQYFFDAPSNDGGAALQKENRRIFSHLHQANLLRADRMTMSHGLEARVPFLDTTFVDIVRFPGLASPALWCYYVTACMDSACVLSRTCSDFALPSFALTFFWFVCISPGPVHFCRPFLRAGHADRPRP